MLHVLIHEWKVKSKREASFSVNLFNLPLPCTFEKRECYSLRNVFFLLIAFVFVIRLHVFFDACLFYLFPPVNYNLFLFNSFRSLKREVLKNALDKTVQNSVMTWITLFACVCVVSHFDSTLRRASISVDVSVLSVFLVCLSPPHRTSDD